MKDEFYHVNDFGLFLVWITLRNELVRLGEKIKLEKDKFELKRNYIITFFSLVEAISYKTRQILLNKHDLKAIILSDEEIYLLNEKSIEIDSKGSIKIKERYFNFESIFKFTYRTYSKHLKKGSIYNHLISDYGYNYFKEALMIRNRIAHPKGPESILVSKVEFENVEKAYDWYNNFITKILEGDVLKKENENDQLN
jgi:hypothetical protein